MSEPLLVRRCFPKISGFIAPQWIQSTLGSTRHRAPQRGFQGDRDECAHPQDRAERAGNRALCRRSHEVIALVWSCVCSAIGLREGEPDFSPESGHGRNWLTNTDPSKFLHSLWEQLKLCTVRRIQISHNGLQGSLQEFTQHCSKLQGRSQGEMGSSQHALGLPPYQVVLQSP